MKISYDPVKRALTLENRALDFDDARKVFARLHLQYGTTVSITARIGT